MVFDEVAHHDDQPRSPGFQSSSTSLLCRLSKTCTGVLRSRLGSAQGKTNTDSEGTMMMGPKVNPAEYVDRKNAADDDVSMPN
jgi:hypothetical protein